MPRPARAAPAALLTGAGAAFALLAVAVVGLDDGWFDRPDAWAAAALALDPQARLRAFLAGVSAWHATGVVLAGTALVAALLWARRDRSGMVLLLATVPGGGLLNHLLKHLIARPRPGVAEALSAATDHGFPSGHVAHATLFYGVLVTLAVQRGAPLAWRWGALAVAALLVGLVGASRITLGAHRLSDVLAGLAVGLGWLCLCLAAEAARRHR